MSPEGSSGIKWNEVTWYSRLLAAILLFVLMPALGFYIATQYEMAVTPSSASIARLSDSMRISPVNSIQVIATSSQATASSASIAPASDSSQSVSATSSAISNEARSAFSFKYEGYPANVANLIEEAGKPFMTFVYSSVTANYTDEGLTVEPQDGVDAYDPSQPEITYAKVADKSHLKMLSFYSFAKDGIHVYTWEGTYPNPRYWEPYLTADAATFHVLGGPYAEDKNHVYFHVVGTVSVFSNDPSSFTFVDEGSGLSKDAAHAYLADQIIPDVDLSSFVLIQTSGHGYSAAKDKNHIYILSSAGSTAFNIYRLPIARLDEVLKVFANPGQDISPVLPDGCYPSSCWGHFGCNYEYCTKADGSTYTKFVN